MLYIALWQVSAPNVHVADCSIYGIVACSQANSIMVDIYNDQSLRDSLHWFNNDLALSVMMLNGFSQIKLYYPAYINTNILYMTRYTYWENGRKRSKIDYNRFLK